MLKIQDFWRHRGCYPANDTQTWLDTKINPTIEGIDEKSTGQSLSLVVFLLFSSVTLLVLLYPRFLHAGEAGKAVSENVYGEFHIATDAAGFNQVYYNGRQQTFGPENKTLIRLLARDRALFNIAVSDKRYQNSVGTVLANKSPLSMNNAHIIRLVISIGQSLALGHNGIVDRNNKQSQAWMTYPPQPGKLLSLKYGINYGGNQSGGVNPMQNGFGSLTSVTLGPIVDAASVSSIPPNNNNDVPALVAALWVGEAHDWDGLYGVVAMGRGGTPIQALSKPETATPSDFDVSYPSYALLAADLRWSADSIALVNGDSVSKNNGVYVKVGSGNSGSWSKIDSYSNIITWLKIFVSQAAVQYPGYRVEVVYIPIIHGEANLYRKTSQSRYSAMLSRLESDLTSDIQSITGQSSVPYFGSGQTATLVEGWAGEPSYANLSDSISDKSRLYWGPQYDLDSYVKQVTGSTDMSHLLPHGSTDLGDKIGIVYFEKIKNGKDSRILYPTSAVRMGQAVVVSFNVPVGSLTINPNISDPGHFGAVFSDSESSASIISAAITSSYQVTFHLDAIPTGSNQTISFASAAPKGEAPGTRSGARSPLCDEAQFYGLTSGKHWPTQLSMSRIAVQ
jgi:hypothetical protein